MTLTDTGRVLGLQSQGKISGFNVMTAGFSLMKPAFFTTVGTVGIGRSEPVEIWSLSTMSAATIQPLLAQIQPWKGSRTPAQRIEQLRMMSGLTTNQIARLFGVTRRSVHNWIAGNAMADHHMQRLMQVESLIEVLPEHTPEQRRARLLDSSVGKSLFQKFVDQVGGDMRLQVPAFNLRELVGT
jgi:DNA-binding transcriptional regulator YiaG